MVSNYYLHFIPSPPPYLHLTQQHFSLRWHNRYIPWVLLQYRPLEMALLPVDQVEGVITRLHRDQLLVLSPVELTQSFQKNLTPQI